MQTFSIEFNAMGGRCEIKIAADNDMAAHRVAMDAISEVRRIEHKFSRYRTDSIVSRMNASAGKNWIDVDEETSSLLSYANEVYLSSEGLFDITTGIVTRAWNFRDGIIPSENQLRALLQRTGWEKVQHANCRVYLAEQGMEIDFGGFGKEYAADRAAGVLLASGAQHGYVNLGGDMRFIGPQPDGSPWQIGIQDPRDQDKTIASIPMYGGAIATSGDYERFFEINGKRYCHIVDPRNGEPVTFWRSISVLAPLAITAGSCSTIAMLKQQDGIDFLNRTGMRYLAVDQDGKLVVDEGRTF